MTSHTGRSFSRRTTLAGLGASGIALAVPAFAIGSTAVAQEATPGATPGTLDESRAVYGTAGGKELTADIYRLPGTGALAPAVILIHGGAWTYGFADPSSMADTARHLAMAGYVCFAISYRLTGDPAGAYQWPDQLDDVQRAVRWVRVNAATYGVDPEAIAAFGHSAGGHLAAMLGLRDTRDDSVPELAGVSSRVDCVIDIAGVSDLAIAYPDAEMADTVTNLLGGPMEDRADAALDASPVHWITSDASPFLVFHGGVDQINPIAHSERLIEALAAANTDLTYVRIAGADHFAIADWSMCGQWSLAFLERYVPLT